MGQAPPPKILGGGGGGGAQALLAPVPTSMMLPQRPQRQRNLMLDSTILSTRRRLGGSEVGGVEHVGPLETLLVLNGSERNVKYEFKSWIYILSFVRYFDFLLVPKHILKF